MPLTIEHVKSIVDPCAQGIWEPFVAAISPDVHWWISSEEHDPICHSGIYNLEQWQTQVAVPMASRLVGRNQDMIVKELDVIGQKAIMESEGKGTQVNGKPYHNRYVLYFLSPGHERGSVHADH
ncbi:hypothetical protein PVAG01_08357 [Phlyctema vagabunda]|uniref:Uncharacterized protein n=1 Tax=Phlyctema vagabunda TaxID=108571 RepID=A0ABR4P967_9HELO